MKQDFPDAVSRLLNADPGPDSFTMGEDDRWDDIVRWWIDQMTRPTAGVNERLTWFWHGHLTTNAYSVNDDRQVADQLSLFRRHSLGNFRELLHAFVTDAALLQYLDGDGSEAYNPNENLGRELMELFTIGPGNYTEPDVKAAARALAGWWVDNDTGEVKFRRDRAFIAPLVYLDRQDSWDTAMVVDALCDHPATAQRVAALLWYELVGTPLTEAAAEELGQWWTEQNLEIRPLVERILRTDQFYNGRLSRPRSGLEFICAVKVAIGVPEIDVWRIEALGQSPYLPPSVAGWPKGDYWLRPGSLMQRLWFVNDVDLEFVTSRGWSVDAILDRLGLPDASATTRNALAAVSMNPEMSPEEQRQVTWRLAMTSPEFQLQ